MAEFRYDRTRHDFIDASREYQGLEQSLLLSDHFSLPDGVEMEALHASLETADILPPATESPEAQRERPHDAWEADWISRMRNGPWREGVNGFFDTNNFWNYFNPNDMRQLRMALRKLQEQKRSDGDFFEPRLYYRSAQLYVWVKSGLIKRAAETLGIHKMELLVENLALRDAFDRRGKENETMRHAKESLTDETTGLLRELAVVMYDLGVDARVIFG